MDWQRRGVLHRLDLAFSRDQAEKIYVQHRMQECRGRALAMAGGGRALLCLRRRQAHGQGRRGHAARDRRRAGRQERRPKRRPGSMASPKPAGTSAMFTERERGPLARIMIMSGPEARAPVMIRTTCPYCGVGCGLKIAPDGKGGADVAGDPEHPANLGRICSKGAALGETLSLEDRLLYPEVDGRRVSWDSRARHRGGRLPRDRDAPRPRRRRLLRLRPAPDRGLLRRQQAHQELLGHRQHRHQLAALHGLVGGRPQARLRQRHRARPLRGLRAGRPRRAGRQQPRLVPSRAVPAPGSGQARAADDAHRRGRPAPHRDLRHRRPASGVAARQRRRPVQCAAGRSAAPWRHGQALRRQAHGRHGRRADRRPRQRRRPSATCPRPTWTTFFDWFARTEKTVTLYSRGREPVERRRRQGQRADQLPSADRSHRPAGHGAVLDHRPAQRHGRPRSGRAFQHARRAHGLRPGGRRPRRPLLEHQPCAAQSRPEGGRTVRGGACRPRQGGVDHGDQSRRQPAQRRRRPRRPRRLRALRRFRSDARVGHRRCLPRPPARARLGGEERHRHQLRARHLAPAAVPAAARRGAPGLVDHRRGRAPPGPWRGLRLEGCSRHLPRACRGSRPSRTRASATSISAPMPTSTTADTNRSGPSSGRRARTRRPPAPASSPTALLPFRRARPLHRHGERASPSMRRAATGHRG